MNLWIIYCWAGETRMYRVLHYDTPYGKRAAWTTDVNKADIYTDDTLPPGVWTKALAEEFA